jgi:hypothetical protein
LVSFWERLIDHIAQAEPRFVPKWWKSWSRMEEIKNDAEQQHKNTRESNPFAQKSERRSTKYK